MATSTFSELAFHLAETDQERDALLRALHALRSGQRFTIQ